MPNQYSAKPNDESDRLRVLRRTITDSTSPLTNGHPCWLWLGALRGGRPAIKSCGRVHIGARLVFYLHHGRWPQAEVHHECFNAHCLCPYHLSEADRDTNLRASGKRLDSTDTPIIIELLKTKTQAEIAEIYGVGRTAITALLQRASANGQALQRTYRRQRPRGHANGL